MEREPSRSAYVRQTVRALQAYTPGEQPRGGGVIKLNTNENPYPPSPRAIEALQALAAGRLRLYPDPVSQRLRERIAAVHGCRADQVLAGNGSDEVLALCLSAFVEKDGGVGYFEPSYSLYPVLAAIHDLKVKPVRLGPDFGWTMPEDYQASIFFLTNPNAPTSLLFPKERVAGFCRRFPGVVVLDEAYVDFSREHCADLALSLPNVLITRSLSKSYSLAGARVGYAVGHHDLIAALFKIKDSYNLSVMAQCLAEAALDDQDYMRDTRERIKTTRTRVSRELSARGFEVAPSETNFLWVKPPGQRAADVFQYLRERNILVRYFPGPLTGERLRVTIGTDSEMDEFLAAVAARFARP